MSDQIVVTNYPSENTVTTVSKTNTVAIQDSGIQGPPGELIQNFETITQNLKQYNHSINYTGDKVSSLVYTVSAGVFITKTLNYNGEKLASIVISGAVLEGPSLTKTFIYTGENISSVEYS